MNGKVRKNRLKLILLYNFIGMEQHFKILRITRNNILNLMEGLSVEQLNKVPEGLNNNIIWNVAHNIVTQQLLIYRLSGVDIRVSAEMIEQYRKGSKPSTNVSQSEIESIKDLLIKSVDWLEEDYKGNIFSDYKEYTTSYNITLSSTEEAIMFNNTHEGLHLGYAMALKKLL